MTTEYQRKYQRERRARQKDAMNVRKLERGCDVCGYAKCAAALQWHHRDGTTKNVQVSWMLSYKPERLEAEIAKCDLLCANCHHEHHWTKE